MNLYLIDTLSKVHQNAGLDSSLLLPAVLAAIGYVAKNVFDIAVDTRKRKIEDLQDKLKFFYWPILNRLEKTPVLMKMKEKWPIT